MAKIQLSTVQKTANVVVLEMTPSTVLRIGRVHGILERVKAFRPIDEDDDPKEYYCLDDIGYDECEELTSLINELHDELMKM